MRFLRIFSAGLLFLFATAASLRAEIVIGVAGPMSGPLSIMGEQLKRGTEMAVQDINTAGGINGEMLRLEIGDDGCNPDQAVSVASDMAALGAVFVVGHFCSDASIAAAQVYEHSGIVHIIPAQDSASVPEGEVRTHTFRLLRRDPQPALLAGAYMVKHFADQKIALVHDKTTLGKGIVSEIRKALRQGNMREKVFETYPAGQQDYSRLITKLKQSNITATYIAGTHADVGAIVRQMRDQGMKASVIGGSALLTSDFWTVSGPMGEGVLMVTPKDPRLLPGAVSLAARFQESGYSPEGYTLYAYAAVQAFAEALRQVVDSHTMPLSQVLQDGIFQTVIGDVDFNENGDAAGPEYTVYQWSNGQYKEVPGTGELVVETPAAVVSEPTPPAPSSVEEVPPATVPESTAPGITEPTPATTQESAPESQEIKSQEETPEQSVENPESPTPPVSE